MSNDILTSLLSDYEQKKRKAEINFEHQKVELYKKIPRLQEIEDELNSVAINETKNILFGNSSSLENLHQKIESLKEERKKILSKNNLSINDLQPKYECCLCKDTGYIKSGTSATVMCSCLKQKLLNISYNKSNMTNLSKENFENFNQNIFSNEISTNFNISPKQNILNIKQKCIEFVNDFDNPNSKNLLFTGNTGLGKTYMSNCIANELIKKGKNVLYQTAPVLLETIIDNKFNKYKDVELTLSEDELKILRDYQITGVKWLYTLAKTGFGGILADEMGLGKTIQVIYYIKEMLKDDENSKFLIVVPTSLAYNWDHEFAMFGSNIKRKICLGSKEKRINILKNLTDTNVLITTYGLLREDEDLYQNLSFNTMIIDEAQNIKNNMAGITKVVKKIQAETKFALTGTPLENSILELWSIFDFIMPGYLASLTKFQSKYKIKDFDEESEILIKSLSKQINPFILRRKKQDVIKELPEKLVNDIYIELKEDQKKLYIAELNRVKEEMKQIIENDGMNKARFLILQLLTKLRQICIDPKIIYENYTDGSNKLDQLEMLVNEYTKNNHKILIFSSFKTALNIVKEKLNNNKIKTYMIDGSVPAKDRMEMVDNFNNNDDVKVFLIMLKSGGTGLNLATADVVIHLDLWWNPQAENQATDRAHRIGQKNTVEVVHLITKGTIEEKILELQNKKRILSDKLIDGDIRDKNIISELTEDDIKTLLSYENRD